MLLIVDLDSIPSEISVWLVMSHVLNARIFPLNVLIVLLAILKTELDVFLAVQWALISILPLFSVKDVLQLVRLVLQPTFVLHVPMLTLFPSMDNV